MANEIRVAGDVGSTYYVLIRNVSGQVYNTSTLAFEAYAAGSITDYDIALTDSGGGWYLGDFPTSISDDTYVLQKFKQAGASPAITDTYLGAEQLTWIQGSVVPTPPAGLSAYALIDLNSQKRLLDIPTSDSDKDTILIQLINAATTWIEKQTSRNYAARNYKETCWINNSNMVIVNNVPIIRIEKIGLSTTTALEIENDTDLRAMCIVEPTQLTLITTSTTGTQTTTELEYSTYPTILQLAVAVNAVSNYIATVVLNGPSEELVEMIGKDATQGPANLLTIDDGGYNVDYFVHPDIGAISVGNVPAKRAYVNYRAGFETIPADLAQICGEIVRIAYNLVGKDVTRTTDILENTENTIQRSVTELEADKIAILDSYTLLNVASNFF